MFEQLIQQFTSSAQGQTAFQRLQQQGFSPQQSQGFLSAAVPTAAQAFHQAQSGGFLSGLTRPGGPQGLLDVGNSHYVTNFLSGAVSGLIRGNGVAGAAVDGLQGVAGGHVAEVVASRFGLPQRVAGTVGAIVTPLVIDFLWERVGGGGLNLSSLFGQLSGGAANLLGGGSATPAVGGWGGAPGTVPTPFGGSAGGGAPGTLPNPLGSVANLFGGGGAAPGTVSPTIQGGVGALLGNLFGK